ncbi:reverse transcriptase domain-containing protein [Tanacetum coccineum]
MNVLFLHLIKRRDEKEDIGSLETRSNHVTDQRFRERKKDAKPKLIRWVLLLQGFNVKIKDKKGVENFAADHLSRLENPHMEMLTEREIADEFPDEHLMMLKTKFNNDEPWALQKYGVTHMLSTTYDPQSNGQTEVTNMATKRILERSVGYNPKDWSEKLNDALWAFRTAYKTLTGCKLKSKWYGLNIVKTVYPYGAIEITDKNGFSFKVNGQRLKKYYEGNIDNEDEEVVEFETSTTEVLNVNEESSVNIEHLAKDGEKSVFWSINEEDRESLLNLKNTTYHSRWIRYFPKLRQDQDHCLTLKNTPMQELEDDDEVGNLAMEPRFDTRIEGRVANVEKIWNKFIKESLKKQKYSENLIWGIKKNFDHVLEAKASFIKKLEVQLGKIAEIVQNRETGSLPSSTKINPRGLVHTITMRSGLNYKPEANPLVNNEDSNDAQDKHKNDGADDRNEVKEPEVQRKVVKSYVPSIPFPCKLKKEKEKQ